MPLTRLGEYPLTSAVLQEWFWLEKLALMVENKNLFLFSFYQHVFFKIAAFHHAPTADGIERYVFYVAPHIAVDERGEIGKVIRKYFLFF